MAGGCGCGGSSPQVVVAYQPPQQPNEAHSVTNTSDPRYFSIHPGGTPAAQKPARQQP